MLSLLAWIVGDRRAEAVPHAAAERLVDSVGTEAGAAVLAFALLFLPAYLAVKLFATAVGGQARRSVLGPVDRVLGGGFGMLKGLIGATLFFLLANLATDMVYGARRRAAGVDDRSRAPIRLLNASGRAVVDWVETRRRPGVEDEMIRLHDTMAREKREFEPADPKRITMYVCGPTVYGRAHIGNARPAVVFDMLAGCSGTNFRRRQPDLCPQRHRRRRQDHRRGRGGGGRPVGDHRALRALLSRGHGRAGRARARPSRRTPPQEIGADGRDDRAR